MQKQSYEAQITELKTKLDNMSHDTISLEDHSNKVKVITEQFQQEESELNNANTQLISQIKQEKLHSAELEKRLADANKKLVESEKSQAAAEEQKQKAGQEHDEAMRALHASLQQQQQIQQQHVQNALN